MSLLRRAVERRDLVSGNFHGPLATMGYGGIPANSDGYDSATGVPVNERTALGVIAYNSCVQLLADSIASLPWDAFRKREGVRAEVSPQPSLLADPCSEMSVFDWKHILVVSLLTRGNFYGHIVERDRLEYPTNIVPLHPDQVLIERDPQTLEKRIRVSGRNIPAADLFHIPAFRLAGMDEGLSPIGMARHSLGLSLAAQEFGSRWFRDGAAPSSVLETDKDLSSDQVRETQKIWVASHGGRRRPAVLSGGFKWKPITITPEESQFLGTRQNQALEACQILRVPPHMIGIVDKSTSWGTGIEQQSIGFVTYVLRPWLIRIESQLDRISPRGQFAKFNVDGLLRGDTKSRNESYRIAIEGGWRNPDEVRALEDLPPIPGGLGAKYRQPLNFGPLGAEPAEPEPPAPAPEPDIADEETP